MAENITLQVSNLVLPRREAAAGGIATHQAFLNEVDQAVAAHSANGEPGYDGGYELAPTRVLTTAIYGARMLGGDAEARADALFSSVHQTWGGINAFGAIMMRTHGSLTSLGRLSRGERSAVVFGEMREKNGSPYNFHALPLKDAGVQLTVDVLDDWGIDPEDTAAYDDIPHQMAQRGLDNVVVDPFHLYRQGKKDERHIEPIALLDSLEDNGVPIRRIHFRAGNADFPAEKAKTKKDLETLIHEDYAAIGQSEMGSLALRAAQIWERQQMTGRGPVRELSVVNEVTAAALHELHKERQAHDDSLQPFSRPVLIGYHALMAIKTREFFRRSVSLAA